MTPRTAPSTRPVGGHGENHEIRAGLSTLLARHHAKGGLRAWQPNRRRPPSLDQVLKELTQPSPALPTPETCPSDLDPPITGTRRSPSEVAPRDVGPGTAHDATGTAGADPPWPLDATARTAREVIQDALGSLAASLATTGGICRPRIVQHSPSHLDVLVDPPDPTGAPGWHTDGDGAVWTLDTSIPSPGGAAPVPLLVPLGQPDEDGQAYLDLEAEGIVSLIGNPDTARRTLGSMIGDLASPASDEHRVVLVGDHDDLGLGHLAQRGVHSWEEVTDDLVAELEQSHEALVEDGWPNGFIARGARSGRHDLGSVVVAAATPPPAELLRLVRGKQPTTVAMVVLGVAVPGATVLDCQPAQLTVVDLGFVCTPPPIGPPETETTDGPPDRTTPRTEAPVSAVAARPDAEDRLVDQETSGDDPGQAIVVRFLGEISIAGTELLTPKQTAVIAYIALHPTVTADRLEDAVWPAASPRSRRKRLANTLAECRAALGRQHLPRSIDGRYVLGGGVITDTDLFDRHVEQAARESPAAAVESLRSALDLVTGPAFAYRRADRTAFTWVDIENWQSTWDHKISQVAQDCAAIYLTLDQPDAAVTVAHRAHRMMPADSSLTECLMRAHAAGGDRTAVQAVYQAHLTAVHNLQVGNVDRSTSELRDRLCHRDAP